VTGSVALGNNRGVDLEWGASLNRIGTDGDGNFDAAERNVISGNVTGVAIEGEGANANVVAGNLIGLDASGLTPLPNTSGVYISAGAQSNLIGSDGDGLGVAAEGNVISGNGGPGVYISDAGTNNNVVAGNFIGTDRYGTAGLGNGGGVLVWRGPQGNCIGTNGDGAADPAEANVISGNTDFGVAIWDLWDEGTTGNPVRGNTFTATGVWGLTCITPGLPPTTSPTWTPAPTTSRTSPCSRRPTPAQRPACRGP
jgi:hypothetical protein